MKPYTTLPGVAVLVSLLTQSAHAAPFPSRADVVHTREQESAARPQPIVYKHERGVSNEVRCHQNFKDHSIFLLSETLR